MFDGALTIGGPGTAHITWRSPQQVFEIRLRQRIAQMLERTPLPPAGERRLAEIAAEVNGKQNKMLKFEKLKF